PLPPLHKLSRAEPIATSTYVIPHVASVQTITALDKTKKVTKKEPSIKAIKKKAQTKTPVVPNQSPDEKADSSIEQLLFTLMEEIKGLKDQIKPSSDNSLFISQTGSSKSIKGKQNIRSRPYKHNDFKYHLS
nr:hypothetical protein [Tanacetum cinerariifolium]